MGTQSKISFANLITQLRKRKQIIQQTPQPILVILTPWQRLLKELKDISFVKVFLGCSLFLTISFLWLSWLYASHTISQNNFRWRFGPQLDYVNGPPPV